MSKRHKPGDIVFKKETGGFVKQRLRCQIGTGFENQENVPLHWVEPCEDPHCREWPTLWILGPNNKVIGMDCHVHDCEMEDV